MESQAQLQDVGVQGEETHHPPEVDNEGDESLHPPEVDDQGDDFVVIEENTVSNCYENRQIVVL